MGRCNNDTLLKKIGVDKLDKTVEVSFTVMRSLPNCRRIRTNNYIAISDNSKTPAFLKHTRPDNRFECDGDVCTNTGTLIMTGLAANTNVDYFADFDATEFAAGVIAFYVYAPGNAADNTITVSISSDSQFTDADVYTATINRVLEDGFYPVLIDLASTPSSVSGNGWTANQQGAYIRISSSFPAAQNWGISSISIFDSIDDFETMDVVKVGCLSEVGGSFDVETIEATCLRSGYNTDVSGFDYTVTGKTVTPNWRQLNPMIGKGTRTKGYKLTTVRKTIVKPDGSDMGFVCLPDAYQDECGYFAAQLADTCNITLKQLSFWSETIEPDEDHFVVNMHRDTGNTAVIFNKEYIGHEVLISYPQSVEIEETVANAENLEGVRTRMAVPVKLTDGSEELHVFDNVYVTSFPNTINGEETEFSFTINIQKDKDGNYFRIQRIFSEN